MPAPSTTAASESAETGAHRRERRKEARPGELLDAALELFVEKGFAATRAEEVAARAGVSKGTLFLYFPSKEELFKAVVRENLSRVVQESASELDGFEGPSDALLLHFLQQWWSRYGATKASGISKLIISEASNFPELAAFFRDEVVEPGSALLQRVLERGIARGEFREVSLDTTVQLILAPLLFLVLWKHSLGACCSTNAHIEPQAYIAHHADLLLNGLRRNPAPDRRSSNLVSAHPVHPAPTPRSSPA